MPGPCPNLGPSSSGPERAGWAAADTRSVALSATGISLARSGRILSAVRRPETGSRHGTTKIVLCHVGAAPRAAAAGLAAIANIVRRHRVAPRLGALKRGFVAATHGLL